MTACSKPYLAGLEEILDNFTLFSSSKYKWGYPTIKPHFFQDNVNLVINEVRDEEHMTVFMFIPALFLNYNSAKTVNTEDKMTR